MKLLLTSNGILNPSIARALGELLGKPFEKSSVAFVPTAANVERGDKTFVVNDMYNLLRLGFQSFDIIDISAVSKTHWLPSFEQADFLVFGGENVSHLLKWLKKSGVQKELPVFCKQEYIWVYVQVLLPQPRPFLFLKHAYCIMRIREDLQMKEVWDWWILKSGRTYIHRIFPTSGLMF